MLVLKNAQVVVGDGRTPVFSGSIAVEDGTIAAVTPGDLSGAPADTVIDVRGHVVAPGGINAHAHATAPGPRFASGTPGLSLPEVLGNLRLHLVQGHTTVVDLDGFKTPAENSAVHLIQPVKVEKSTVHFDPMFAAADACDGTGLTEEHRRLTAKELADQGAVVIGEVGAGMTLGGGGQDYIYIPAAVANATGVVVDPTQAEALKYAVLGRHIRPGNPDLEQVGVLIDSLGLQKLSVDDLVALIEQSVLPSMASAREGVVRSASLARDLGIPTLVHNAAASDDATREAARVAGGLFIGGHTNHDSYTADEAIANARWIRSHGGHVEIDTFSSWGRGDLRPNTPSHLIPLVQEDLVDIIATDYGAGSWDSAWEMVAAIIQSGLASVEKAVAMATGNVARAIPRIGQTRGLVRPGLAADLVVASPRNLSDIELVLINGEIAHTSPTGPFHLESITTRA
ncbi:hypothetical protein LLS1_37160 [Leifsonia sp. LS1]|uniref:amidohydrolase family protein n=1 Tax=Leifsonia sp. LS1 TaxID=2828483 RepID=UPI002088ACB0|nr:amidohydrolase family protein [Leifsonia sp. LS1]GIT82047.1 hypothetical protein LLS1_37160 [Leifsonia sp. LS1]